MGATSVQPTHESLLPANCDLAIVSATDSRQPSHHLGSPRHFHLHCRTQGLCACLCVCLSVNVCMHVRLSLSLSVCVYVCESISILHLSVCVPALLNVHVWVCRSGGEIGCMLFR